MGLDSSFIYIVLAATSIVTFGLGIILFGLNTAALGVALREFVECIGAFVLFFAINVTAGMAAVFALRGLLGFVSLYPMTELMLALLSAVQGFVFQMWWRRAGDRKGNLGRR